eukprot:11453507-Heterocapsa_arctica.AAC.1
MEKVVASCAVNNSVTKPLEKLCVDDLPVLRVVAHLLEEYGSRLKLNETMGLAGFAGAGITKATSRSSGLGEDGDKGAHKP